MAAQIISVPLLSISPLDQTASDGFETVPSITKQLGGGKFIPVIDWLIAGHSGRAVWGMNCLRRSNTGMWVRMPLMAWMSVWVYLVFVLFCV
jgi:hypothetical protein